jgi:hypothetical protein
MKPRRVVAAIFIVQEVAFLACGQSLRGRRSVVQTRVRCGDDAKKGTTGGAHLLVTAAEGGARVGAGPVGGSSCLANLQSWVA